MNLATSVQKNMLNRANSTILTGQIDQQETSHALTEADFTRLAAFAHREFGLYLPPNKLQHVRSRMVKVLAQTQATDFKTLCDRIEANPHGQERAPLIGFVA